MLARTVRPASHQTRVLTQPFRHASTAVAATATPKAEGDISNAFVSMSSEFKALPERYAHLKHRLIAGREDQVQASWERLLARLREEIPVITSTGSQIVPEIDFTDIERPSQHFRNEIKKRGVAIIRNVVGEQEALDYKAQTLEYIRNNPQTKGFPADAPAVWELYWSPAQMKARAHPNMLKTQRFLMNFWHSEDPNAAVSVDHPAIYADRLRIRPPGDSKFALGPHVDGGSVERWEEHGYGLGKVYDKVFEGNWEEHDPWEASCRLPASMNNYDGAGACSMLRFFQGWLAMSDTGPYEGTLLVNPLLPLATSYYLLRPFFTPRAPVASFASEDEFLHPRNWSLSDLSDTSLPGATPGYGQELNAALHPHLKLDQTMTHVPRVRPGDYVAWHCDTVHAVDSTHAGQNDSSVMYIPACPLTESNAVYLKRQREAFLAGTPGPDFPGGVGESNHLGRPTVEDVAAAGGELGMKAMGLEAWDAAEDGVTSGEQEAMNRSNKILGFYD